MPVPFGGSTNWPLGPPKVWMTPTDLLPGSRTIAIGIVTTPVLAAGSTAAGAPVLVRVDAAVVAGGAADERPPPPVAPADNAPTKRTAASGLRFISALSARRLQRPAAPPTHPPAE